MKFNLATEVVERGARVRLVRIDRYGFCGRELHPKESDIGFEGVVVDACTDQSTHAVTGMLTGEDWVCYTVMDEYGRKLELMNFELERALLPDSLYGHLERCGFCGVYEGGPHVERMHPKAQTYPAGAVICAEPALGPKEQNSRLDYDQYGNAEGD